jgi:hypothetical protein
VVLRGQHDVLHARALGLLGPVDRIEQVRLEVARVALVRLCLDPLAVHQPLVASAQCVQTPVHEETEAIVGEPIEREVRHAIDFSLVAIATNIDLTSSSVLCRQPRTGGAFRPRARRIRMRVSRVLRAAEGRRCKALLRRAATGPCRMGG